MNFYDVVENVANNSGMSYRAISTAMGKTPNYIAAMKTNNRIPSIENAARIVGVAGYALCAIPEDEIPEGALRITAGDREE